jgi:hypothetical protein
MANTLWFWKWQAKAESINAEMLYSFGVFSTPAGQVVYAVSA